ncbi:unnamed protein product [Acanthoscelides obtectus]|uniref:Active regulator of SIRT1 n=1 Tax=Acanthoscelides obtectus TaxID=200917 RepID=A0A9P0K7Q7_ACAOB|nr:unnamed protein product [Acanthoscelides obtectus]CAK1631136.1 hypothetical protein AOBTE_LOCUS6773 [Acanthoscelides obtectus]
MSASLVRKSLQIVDPEYNINKQSRKKKKDVLSIAPQNHKLTKKFQRRGAKTIKIGLLSSEKKLTVAELRKQLKPKQEILKENLKKLQLIKEASKVELDRETVAKIVERAVTKRPIKKRSKKTKNQKTVFTEEDFKTFEEEYFDE